MTRKFAIIGTGLLSLLLPACTGGMYSDSTGNGSPGLVLLERRPLFPQSLPTPGVRSPEQQVAVTSPVPPPNPVTSAPVPPGSSALVMRRPVLQPPPEPIRTPQIPSQVPVEVPENPDVAMQAGPAPRVKSPTESVTASGDVIAPAWPSIRGAKPETERTAVGGPRLIAPTWPTSGVLLGNPSGNASESVALHEPDPVSARSVEPIRPIAESPPRLIPPSVPIRSLPPSEVSGPELLPPPKPAPAPAIVPAPEAPPLKISPPPPVLITPPSVPLTLPPPPAPLKPPLLAPVSTNLSPSPSIVAHSPKAESILIRAIRAFQENRPEEAVETLRKVDPRDQEVMLYLVPIIAELGETSTARMNPEELGLLVDRLQEALVTLKSKAALKMDTVCLVSRVDGFGKYTRLDPSQVFLPGSRVQTYLELRNATWTSSTAPGSPKTPQKGYAVSLACRLELHDGSGRIVWESEEMVREDFRQTLSTDYHLSPSFGIPETLQPGIYQLLVKVTDKPTGRITRKTLEFRIGKGK